MNRKYASRGTSTNTRSIHTSSTVDTGRVYPLAIVGAGIHGVHLATSLVERHIHSPSEIVMIDHHPEPLFVWDRRVRNCGMLYLRSPASHGLAPDFRTLRSCMKQPADSTPPYHRPSIEVFRRHAHERLERYARGINYHQGSVLSVTRNSDDGTFRLTFDVPPSRDESRTALSARALILSPGTTTVHVPEPLRELRDTNPAVRHVHDLTFDPDSIHPGERVLIVGGGIAAVHLALMLRRRQVALTVWTRDSMPVYQFDSDPCFIGPRCGGIVRGRVAVGSDTNRAIVERNRRPGSVPEDLKREFLRAASHNEFVHRNVELKSAIASGRRFSVSGVGRNGGIERGEFDRVIACTGFTAGPPAPDLVQQIANDLSAPLGAGGFPCPSMRDLSWVPGLFLTGGLADLVLGPPARNIIGAHLARRRILPALARMSGRLPAYHPLSNSRSS